MDDFASAREVSVEVVYVDEHLIELAVTVSTGYWRGRCTAYTLPADMSRFAQPCFSSLMGDRQPHSRRERTTV
jgi:hypothetical protein